MRRYTIAAAAAALAGGFLATVGPTGPASADDPAPVGELVALGDSYAAGIQLAPQRGDTASCGRSEVNYAGLTAARFNTTIVDATCSGAETVDLTQAQHPDAPPQLDALSADTTLVTFGTIGGNDMGLVGLATSCVIGDCPDPVQEQEVNEGIETARTNLTAGVAEAKEKAPNAEIYLIGYGTYLPKGGCYRLPGITPVEADYVQGKINELSAMIKKVAADSGVHFVDMRAIPGAAKHTACASPNAQWVRALETYGDGAPLHPSACGHVAMSQQVIRTIQQVNGDPVDAFDDSCVSAGPDNTADRMAVLKSVAETVTFSATCTSKKSGKGSLTARTKGGYYMAPEATERGPLLVAKVKFRVGEKKIAVDRAAPFKVKAKAKPWVKRKGKVIAEVTLRDAELSKVRTLKVDRPGCIRR